MKLPPKTVGLPRHRPDVIGARNPWDAQTPMLQRSQRGELYRWRKDNPLPPASPFWQLVKF